MNNGAHGAIDKEISQNNLNPKNVKNKVKSKTLNIYGLFEDYMLNRGTAIFNAQTQGGDNRFYKRGFDMPSAYADPSDDDITKDQIMQVLKNSIRQSPDDTVSTQSVQNLYKLHEQPMPKYERGGFIKSLFGKGEKGKSEALKHLEAILSSQYEMEEGKTDFPVGRNVAGDEIYPDGANIIRKIARFSTPEGDRYYPGEGESRSNSLANQKAMMDAAKRAYHSPKDSLSTEMLHKLKNDEGYYKLFE